MHIRACITVSLLSLLFIPQASAQEAGTPPPASAPTIPTLSYDLREVSHVDIIYTDDGGIYRGVIIEQGPSVPYRIAIAGGSVLVVEREKIVRITREVNSSYSSPPPPTQPAAAPLSQPAASPAQSGDTEYHHVTQETSASVHREATDDLPPRLVEEGHRSSVALGLAIPTGDFGDPGIFNSSLDLAVRLGKEFMYGRVGVTPAFHGEMVYWSHDIPQDIAFMLVHLGGEVRLAGHYGSFVPYVSGGLGLEMMLNDDRDSGVGLGLQLSAGADILLNSSTAVSLALAFHPGFTPIADVEGAVDVTFMGLMVGLSKY